MSVTAGILFFLILWYYDWERGQERERAQRREELLLKRNREQQEYHSDKMLYGTDFPSLEPQYPSREVAKARHLMLREKRKAEQKAAEDFLEERARKQEAKRRIKFTAECRQGSHGTSLKDIIERHPDVKDWKDIGDDLAEFSAIFLDTDYGREWLDSLTRRD